jgi:hypothetical protein
MTQVRSQEANPYTYTADNPVNLVDPTGGCFLGLFGNCGGSSCNAGLAFGGASAFIAAGGFAEGAATAAEFGIALASGGFAVAAAGARVLGGFLFSQC